MNDPKLKVSMRCGACGATLEKVLRNLDSIPDCEKCGSNLLVENVTKENHDGTT